MGIRQRMRPLMGLTTWAEPEKPILFLFFSKLSKNIYRNWDL